MRTLFRTCTLIFVLASFVSAQDLEQLQKIIADNTPATLPNDLGRKPPPPELVDGCKKIVEAANQIYALPNLDENDRYRTLQREASALIVLAYAETPKHYTRLATVSDELDRKGNKKLSKLTEEHVLKIGSALATTTKPVGNVGINIESLAERMVLYAEQYPGQESTQMIEQLLSQVHAMNANPRDRRLAVIAPKFHKYFQSVNHVMRAKALEPDILRATLPDNSMLLMGVDINGNDLNLNALQDKVVLLQFWGTWCPHCKEEIPLLISLYDKYHKAGLEIIGVNTGVKGDDERKVKQFIDTTTFEGKKIPWTILHEGLGERKNKTTLTKYYGIDELPVLILIGRNGKVLNLHPLPSTLDNLIADATSLSATIEFTEEEKKILEENKRKQDEEIDRQIKAGLGLQE